MSSTINLTDLVRSVLGEEEKSRQRWQTPDKELHPYFANGIIYSPFGEVEKVAQMVEELVSAVRIKGTKLYNPNTGIHVQVRRVPDNRDAATFALEFHNGSPIVRPQKDDLQGSELALKISPRLEDLTQDVPPLRRKYPTVVFPADRRSQYFVEVTVPESMWGEESRTETIGGSGFLDSRSSGRVNRSSPFMRQAPEELARDPKKVLFMQAAAVYASQNNVPQYNTTITVSGTLKTFPVIYARYDGGIPFDILLGPNGHNEIGDSGGHGTRWVNNGNGTRTLLLKTMSVKGLTPEQLKLYNAQTQVAEGQDSIEGKITYTPLPVLEAKLLSNKQPFNGFLEILVVYGATLEDAAASHQTTEIRLGDHYGLFGGHSSLGSHRGAKESVGRSGMSEVRPTKIEVATFVPIEAPYAGRLLLTNK